MYHLYPRKSSFDFKAFLNMLFMGSAWNFMHQLKGITTRLSALFNFHMKKIRKLLLVSI